MNNMLRIEGYDPGGLLDLLISKLGLKNDAALCRVLDIKPPMISKIRAKKLAINGDLLLRIYDVTGYTVDQCRAVAGIPKIVVEPPVKPFKRVPQGGANVESV